MTDCANDLIDCVRVEKVLEKPVTGKEGIGGKLKTALWEALARKRKDTVAVAVALLRLRGPGAGTDLQSWSGGGGCAGHVRGKLISHTPDSASPRTRDRAQSPLPVTTWSLLLEEGEGESRWASQGTVVKEKYTSTCVTSRTATFLAGLLSHSLSAVTLGTFVKGRTEST